MDEVRLELLLGLCGTAPLRYVSNELYLVCQDGKQLGFTVLVIFAWTSF